MSAGVTNVSISFLYFSKWYVALMASGMFSSCFLWVLHKNMLVFIQLMCTIPLQFYTYLIYVCRRWNQPTGNCRGCKSDMVGAASATRIRGRTLKSYYFKELMFSKIFYLFLFFFLCIKFTLSKCLDSVMVLGNSHMAMARTNKLAVIASHCQDRWCIYTLYISPGGEKHCIFDLQQQCLYNRFI